ncbi:DUF309 domain-containing protein [Staphylococcus americanisciuri]|uniref:DUF309 domain-containing protein n=1 Tax=Staphylococcus americanisciuri TaxID=2973940 RepID=A0ABT2EZ26_9STAP|nr:DUF309 domain-containing protein [Staphylococcus americanisciuri]MCS4485480.1 DUF309 domain-containing protein [Staphylococcus americanisciuri]
MQNALIEFYYQFHAKQHYFLCHDILEDAWKAQDQYAKDDLIVSLILFATGSYHYRRQNFHGAYRSYRKAGKIVENYSDEAIEALGLVPHAFRQQIQILVTATKAEKPFQPIEILLTATIYQKLLTHYPSYKWYSAIVKTPSIMHHHRNRDRSDVIAAREMALSKRQKNKKY